MTGGTVAAAATVDRRSFKTWWKLVENSVMSWLDDYAPSMGAALSYYTVFSLAPLLLIVVSVAGLVFGEEAVRGELLAQLQSLMGNDAAQAVQALLAGVDMPSRGIVGTIVGIGIVVFGATTVFAELQNDLDRIWRAPARQNGGLWSLLRARLLSFGLILGLAFLLMISLVLGAVISALGKWWGPMFGGWVTLAAGVNVVVGFGLTVVIFAMIYKMMPRVHVRWHDVWLGALVTAVLFTIGKFLIGLYIGNTGIASAFGAAASLVIVFIWVYYSAQIFLLGAEFTAVYARTLGSMQGRQGSGQAAGEHAAEAARKPPIRSGSDRMAVGDAAAAAAPATAGARAQSGRARAPSSLAEIGVGVALVLAIRFVLPRLLRRL